MSNNLPFLSDKTRLTAPNVKPYKHIDYLGATDRPIDESVKTFPKSFKFKTVK